MTKAAAKNRAQPSIWQQVGDELVLQQLAGHRSLLLVPVHALADEIQASIRHAVGHWWSLFPHTDLHHGDHRVVELAPGALGGAHLDHDATEAPDIRTLLVASVRNDLRRHPRNGALERARHGLLDP